MPTTVDPLAVLADAAAHFVLVGTDKVPVMKAWQKHPADLAAVRSHVNAGGLVGVMPASLGLVAVDCDAALPLGRRATGRNADALELPRSGRRRTGRGAAGDR